MCPDDLLNANLNYFKSNFARSIVINSKKSHAVNSIQTGEEKVEDFCMKDAKSLKKIELNNGCNSSYGLAMVQTQDVSVENYVLKSQITTLQWQLQQAESNRQMYRMMLEQTVEFLERAHRSLDLLHKRLNSNSRKKSTASITAELASQTLPEPAAIYNSTPNKFLKSTNNISLTSWDSTFNNSNKKLSLNRSSNNISSDVSLSTLKVVRAHSTSQIRHDADSVKKRDEKSSFREYTMWRKPKHPLPDEISSEELSFEALRLLNATQSLLNTQEPNLIKNDTKDCTNDQEFLQQLAKEFPGKPSGSPTLISSKNTKLSLCLQDSECLLTDPFTLTSDNINPVDHSLETNTTPALSSLPVALSTINKTNYPIEADKYITKDKPESPPMSSISSDESGFSSISSFHDVGLPSHGLIEKKRNIIEAKVSVNSKIHGNLHQEVGLPALPVHRRWSSVPVQEKDQIRVHWV